MAVYNGGIRFAPDVYYEIKEMNDSDIKVLRNGIELSSNNVTLIKSVYDESIDNAIIDATWQEIYNAFQKGLVILLYMDPVDQNIVTTQRIVCFVGFDESDYIVVTMKDNDGFVDSFKADNPTDKPVFVNYPG